MEEKVEKYFNILHPEYKDLSSVEQFTSTAALRDKSFIINNLEAIENLYLDYGDSDRYTNFGSEQEKMQEAIIHVKVEKYFDILHPEYKDLSGVEQFTSPANYDKYFIIENLEAIENLYLDYSNSESQLYMQSASDQEKMQKAINEVKNRTKEHFSTQEIGKATINVSLADKKAAEENENSKSIEVEIEGNEVNDD